MHPLSGADPRTLVRVLREAGPVAPGAKAKLNAVWGSVLGRQPFSVAEKVWLAGQLPALEDMPPPVFILGHWRSGTTHLYQVMVEADFGFVPPAATGLPWDLFLMGSLFRKQIESRLPEKRFIDNIPVKPDSPQEDEIALANMSHLSFYHGIYFPRKLQHFVDTGVFFDGVSPHEIEEWRETFSYFLRKLYLHQGRKRLLIKNPVYTARLALLRQMMPEAKFIHIHRDPVDVFLSMRNFYTKLLKEFALQDYALEALDIDGLIASTYERMMSALDHDAAAVPPSQLATIRYETFAADPLPELERVWGALELGDFAAWRRRFAAYLDSVRSFEKNRFDKDPVLIGRIRERLKPWCERFGAGSVSVGA
jgi:hypothetical protein